VISSRRYHCRLGISAGPGPRVVRASASAPIDFRRGDRSPVGGNEICKSDRPGMRMASTSGLRLPSAVHAAGTRSSVGVDPALGFASCRVVGHFAVQRTGLDPACDHQPPDEHGGQFFCRRTRPIRSWAFATLLPITHNSSARRCVARAEFRDWRRTEPSPRVVAALQRLDGTDALSGLNVDRAAAFSAGSLSEVLHRP
jgi:hypothetical protein